MTEQNRLLEIYSHFKKKVSFVLSEAVENAVSKTPYMLSADDIQFIEQFPDQYKAQALEKRFDMLFGYLLELQNVRKYVYQTVYADALNNEKSYWSKELGGWSQLANDEQSRLQADAKAKATAVKLIPAGELIKSTAWKNWFRKAKENKIISLGDAKDIEDSIGVINNYFLDDTIKKKFFGFKVGNESPRNFHAVADLSSLAKNLEGEYGQRNGYDLFHPVKLRYEKGNKKEDFKPKYKTDTFVFPSLSVIKRQLENHVISQSTDKVEKGFLDTPEGQKETHVEYKHDAGANDAYKQLYSYVYRKIMNEERNKLREKNAKLKASGKKKIKFSEEISKQKIAALARQKTASMMQVYFPLDYNVVDAKVNKEYNDAYRQLYDTLYKKESESLKNQKGGEKLSIDDEINLRAEIEEKVENELAKRKIVKKDIGSGQHIFHNFANHLENLEKEETSHFHNLGIQPSTRNFVEDLLLDLSKQTDFRMPFGSTTIQQRRSTDIKRFKESVVLEAEDKQQKITDKYVNSKLQFHKGDDQRIEVLKKPQSYEEFKYNKQTDSIEFDNFPAKEDSGMVLRPSAYIEPLKVAMYSDSSKMAYLFINPENTKTKIKIPIRDLEINAKYEAFRNMVRGRKTFDPILFEYFLSAYLSVMTKNDAIAKSRLYVNNIAVTDSLKTKDGKTVRFSIFNSKTNPYEEIAKLQKIKEVKKKTKKDYTAEEQKLVLLNKQKNLALSDLKKIYEASFRYMWQASYPERYQQGTTVSSTFSFHPTRTSSAAPFLSRAHNQQEIQAAVQTIKNGVIINKRNTTPVDTLQFIKERVAQWINNKTTNIGDDLSKVFLRRAQDIFVSLIQNRLLESLADDKLFTKSYPDLYVNQVEEGEELADKPNYIYGPYFHIKIINLELKRYYDQDIAFTGSIRTRAQFLNLLRQNEDLYRCKMQQRRHDAGSCLLGLDLRTINRMTKSSIFHAQHKTTENIADARAKIKLEINGYIELFKILFELIKIQKRIQNKSWSQKDIENTAANEVSSFAIEHGQKPIQEFIQAFMAKYTELINSKEFAKEKNEFLDKIKLELNPASKEFNPKSIQNKFNIGRPTINVPATDDAVLNIQRKIEEDMQDITEFPASIFDVHNNWWDSLPLKYRPIIAQYREMKHPDPKQKRLANMIFGASNSAFSEVKSVNNDAWINANILNPYDNMDANPSTPDIAASKMTPKLRFILIKNIGIIFSDMWHTYVNTQKQIEKTKNAAVKRQLQAIQKNRIKFAEYINQEILRRENSPNEVISNVEGQIRKKLNTDLYDRGTFFNFMRQEIAKFKRKLK